MTWTKTEWKRPDCNCGGCNVCGFAGWAPRICRELEKPEPVPEPVKPVPTLFDTLGEQ